MFRSCILKLRYLKPMPYGTLISALLRKASYKEAWYVPLCKPILIFVDFSCMLIMVLLQKKQNVQKVVVQMLIYCD